MKVYIAIIDDNHPDQTQRPLHLFGPFVGIDAAGEWGNTNGELIHGNDWQVVTMDDAGGYSPVPIHAPEKALLTLPEGPLHPVRPEDLEMYTRIYRALGHPYERDN